MRVGRIQKLSIYGRDLLRRQSVCPALLRSIHWPVRFPIVRSAADAPDILGSKRGWLGCL